MYVSLCGGRCMYGDTGMEVCVVVGLFMEVRGQHAGVKFSSQHWCGCLPARPFHWPKSLLLNCTTYDICLGISGKGYLKLREWTIGLVLLTAPPSPLWPSSAWSEIFLSLLSLWAPSASRTSVPRLDWSVRSDAQRRWQCLRMCPLCVLVSFRLPPFSMRPTNSVKRAERREREMVTLLQTGRAGLSERKRGQPRSPGMGKRNLAAGCG